MKKVYAIVYGFYSSFDSPEYESFWTLKSLANKELMEHVKRKNLKPAINRQTKKPSGAYTDGDMYYYIIDINLNESYY